MTKSCSLFLAVAIFADFAICADPPPQRIVFLGDSITDNNTYLTLIRQALAAAKLPVPVCINAGVGGDTADKMRQRIERDVLPHKPTLVILSAGVNDAIQKITTEDYETAVVAIADRIKDAKTPLVLMTTTLLGPSHTEQGKQLAAYNAVLRKLAEQRKLPLVEVNRAMEEAQNTGKQLLDRDDVHPNLEGHRVIARAVLEALGHKDVTVPVRPMLELMLGVIRDWQIRAVNLDGDSLDEEAVKAVKPDDSWKKLTLPETLPAPDWWQESERARGFALSLKALAGPAATHYLGVATVDSDKAKKVYFNTGAHLQTIWLNGKRIYKSEGWTGWHAGKERIAAELQAGKNTIVIETGPAFFLSVTEGNAW